MEPAQPLLSAAVVVGPCRKRGQRSVNALCHQTAIDSMEVIVVDLAADGVPPLETPPGVRVKYVRSAALRSWSMARIEAVRLADTPIVAFMEDHCYASAGWAEALIERHKEDWAAVGYTFTNANPESWLSRASMVNDYGYWMHPAAPGPRRLVPGNNVSYKRDVLLQFGEALKEMLTPDFALQEVLSRKGYRLTIEPRALAAHENWTRFVPFLRANCEYSWFLGAHRAATQDWGRLRRLLYAAGSPATAVLFGMCRQLLTLRGRTSLAWPVIEALPVYVVTHFFSGVGESLGYLLGKGPGQERMDNCELGMPRSTTD